MVKYDKELAEILQGRELFNLSAEEINAIQKRQDEIRMQKLDSYLADGIITRFDYDYLRPYCENTMAPYKELYDAICRSRGQSPGSIIKILTPERSTAKIFISSNTLRRSPLWFSSFTTTTASRCMSRWAS